MKALIDADILRYRIGFACQKTEYIAFYEDGDCITVTSAEAKELEKLGFEIIKTVIAEPIANALHSVKLAINNILQETGAMEYELYLSKGQNFRDTIVDYYKKNRDPSNKPVHYEAIGRYLIERYQAQEVEGIEADDAIGIAQYNSTDTIICSIDKDLNMIPGWHYNFVKKEKYFVDDKEAMRAFWMQMLTGDRVDNIKGIENIGPARATAAFVGCNNSMDDCCVVGGMYAVAFDNPETKFLENARLLWILRKREDQHELVSLDFFKRYEVQRYGNTIR